MANANFIPRKILIAEDEPAVLDLLVTRLSIAGYQTFQARNGRDAINRLTDVMPTALILDINMPIADGFEVLYHMRRKGLTGVIPVMILTARNRPEDVRKAIDLGAMDFLAKPFKDAHLLARVARLLRRPPPNREAEQFDAPKISRRGSPGS